MWPTCLALPFGAARGRRRARPVASFSQWPDGHGSQLRDHEAADRGYPWVCFLGWVCWPGQVSDSYPVAETLCAFVFDCLVGHEWLCEWVTCCSTGCWCAYFMSGSGLGSCTEDRVAQEMRSSGASCIGKPGGVALKNKLFVGQGGACMYVCSSGPSTPIVFYLSRLVCVGSSWWWGGLWSVYEVCPF